MEIKTPDFLDVYTGPHTIKDVRGLVYLPTKNTICNGNIVIHKTVTLTYENEYGGTTVEIAGEE